MQQLRGRFLLRLWLGAARRQREERALLRLAACSVAGALPRSPGTALAMPECTPQSQLKVLTLQTADTWRPQELVTVPSAVRAHIAQALVPSQCTGVNRQRVNQARYACHQVTECVH